MKPRATIETFPSSRLATFDVGVIGGRKHQITGLLEIDVTTARHRLRELRRNGTPCSLFAWFVKTVAVTVQAEPQAHGIRRGRLRRVVFSDVDASVMVEKMVGSAPVPIPLVIRSAQEKTITEIDSEIAAALEQRVSGVKDYQLGGRPSSAVNALYYLLPQFARVAIMKTILRNPFVRKSTMGTVLVTSAGSSVRTPGWIVPRTMHNLTFALGSVVRKPRVVAEQVVPRDVLHLTVLMDHDVIDGAPAARFTARLVKNLESAVGL